MHLAYCHGLVLGRVRAGPSRLAELRTQARARADPYAQGRSLQHSGRPGCGARRERRRDCAAGTVVAAWPELPEAIKAGVARLVGQDPKTIVAVARRLLEDPQAYRSMARGVSPYGDGRASARIASIVRRHLGVGRRRPALKERTGRPGSPGRKTSALRPGRARSLDLGERLQH